MHRRITPPLIEEPACTIKVIEIIAVLFATPEPEIANLKITPEVACRVAMRFVRILRSPMAILKPFPRIILVYIFGVIRDEFESLWPECFNRFGGVVDVYVKTVCLVVIGHPSKNVVVNVAEEVNIGLDAPVVLVVGEGWVLGKEPAVPSAHLMVGLLLHVLHAVLVVGEEGYGLAEEIAVYPGWHIPVFGGYEF